MKLDKKSGIITDLAQHIIPGGRDMHTRRIGVLHYTEGASAASSIEWWEEPKNREDDLGAHFIIERDGRIIQCRSINKTISHAGTSRWVDPKTGRKYKMCNGFSIGIELANAGSRVDKISVKGLPGYAGTVAGKHRNGGDVHTWEAFNVKQALACRDLCQTLTAAYNLDDITGHDCIAPERKTDPGPAFEEFMKSIREACGFGLTLPVVHRA